MLFNFCGMAVQGDRTDKRDTSAFNTWKDIIIPGNVDDEMTKYHTVVQPLPLAERKYLANFLGRAQGKIGRLQLVEFAKQFPDKVCLLLSPHSCFAESCLFISFPKYYLLAMFQNLDDSLLELYQSLYFVYEYGETVRL